MYKAIIFLHFTSISRFIYPGQVSVGNYSLSSSMVTNFKQEFNSWSKAPVWICLLLNNAVASCLLGITFLTGPPSHMPYYEVILRLASYVFIVSLIFSLITIGLLAFFKRFKIGLQVTYLKAFLVQMALLIGGYLIVYLFIHLRFQLNLF